MSLTDFDPKNIDVIVLCGGLGTRLRSVVADKPKSLAHVGEKPFLDILIDDLRGRGFKSIILAVGHMADQIIDHYKDRSDILFSQEEQPLGTGGAVKNTRPLLRGGDFIVMNGDSVCQVSFQKLYSFHKQKNSFVTIVLGQSEHVSVSGSIKLDSSGRILDFQEKVPGPLRQSSSEAREHGLVNGGIYVMKPEIFDFFPDVQTFSLEYVVFPIILGQNCFGFTTDSEVVDIGTPERYRKAKDMFSKT